MWDYCFLQKNKFIKMLLYCGKDGTVSGDLDLEQLELNPSPSENSAGTKQGGPIAQFDIPSRFRWLTAFT
jgi:hypothetical protein